MHEHKRFSAFACKVPFTSAGLPTPVSHTNGAAHTRVRLLLTYHDTLGQAAKLERLGTAELEVPGGIQSVPQSGKGVPFTDAQVLSLLV